MNITLSQLEEAKVAYEKASDMFNELSVNVDEVLRERKQLGLNARFNDVYDSSICIEDGYDGQVMNTIPLESCLTVDLVRKWFADLELELEKKAQQEAKAKEKAERAQLDELLKKYPQ